MYVDNLLEVSDAQALTASAASTDVIDLGSDRDIAPGRQIYLVVTLDVASDGTTGDETYTAAIQTDDNSGFSSATTLATVTIPRSSAAGTMFVIPVPYGNERYLRAYYTLGGTTPTVTLSAHFTDQEPYSWQAYADGSAP